MSFSNRRKISRFHTKHFIISAPIRHPISCQLDLGPDVIVSAAARRSISVGGGGAPPVKKDRRRRRGVGGQKHFFLRFTKKFRSILKIFLGIFLVIKALRFADDQCWRAVSPTCKE